MFRVFNLILFTYATQNLCAFAEQYSKFGNGQELLLCRECGADVADSYYIFNKASPGARKTDKQNLFGKKNVTLQTLVNPFGVKFEIITLEKARCDNIGSQQSADSWFPGYTWRICACPHCGQHLGWTFTSTDKNIEKEKEHVHSFHGLILSHVLGENSYIYQDRRSLGIRVYGHTQSDTETRQAEASQYNDIYTCLLWLQPAWTSYRLTTALDHHLQYLRGIGWCCSTLLAPHGKGRTVTYSYGFPYNDTKNV